MERVRETTFHRLDPFLCNAHTDVDSVLNLELHVVSAGNHRLRQFGLAEFSGVILRLLQASSDVLVRCPQIVVKQRQPLHSCRGSQSCTVVWRTMSPARGTLLVLRTRILAVLRQQVRVPQMPPQILRDTIRVLVICEDHEDLSGRPLLETVGDRSLRVICLVHPYYETLVYRETPFAMEGELVTIHEATLEDIHRDQGTAPCWVDDEGLRPWVFQGVTSEPMPYLGERHGKHLGPHNELLDHVLGSERTLFGTPHSDPSVRMVGVHPESETACVVRMPVSLDELYFPHSCGPDLLAHAGETAPTVDHERAPFRDARRLDLDTHGVGSKVDHPWADRSQTTTCSEELGSHRLPHNFLRPTCTEVT